MKYEPNTQGLINAVMLPEFRPLFNLSVKMGIVAKDLKQHCLIAGDGTVFIKPLKETINNLQTHIFKSDVYHVLDNTEKLTITLIAVMSDFSDKEDNVGYTLCQRLLLLNTRIDNAVRSKMVP